MKTVLTKVAVVAALAAIGLVSAAVGAAATSKGSIRPAEEPVSGRYIVALKPSAATGLLAARLSRSSGARLQRVYRHAFHGFSASMTRAAALRLSRDPRVVYVEEDGIVRASATQSSPPSWGLDRIDQRALPLNSSYGYDQTGSGVTVYVVDTGVYAQHTDFGGRVVAGFTSIQDGRGTSDCQGHGTHVAGTIAGARYGVAKGATIVPVRVLDCNGTGTMSGVVAGVDWITANHRKPAVANLSLGGSASNTLDSVVRRSITAGVTYAVAAGNGNALGVGEDACLSSPARVGEAITIGATDRSDQRATFSNFGGCVDLFGPGVGITSTGTGTTTAVASMSGTSMATPHVAGAAALWLQGNTSASPSAVAEAIVNGSTTGTVGNAGVGSPNRLLYARLAGAPANAAPAASFRHSCTGLSCSFTDQSTDSDGTIASWRWAFGDGGIASTRNASRTYAAAGSYAVSLTVTDSAGASTTTSRTLTVSAPAATPILLTGTASSVNGYLRTVLQWTGATTRYVDVYRNGVRVATTRNDGLHVDYVRLSSVTGAVSYVVCESGSTSRCSNSTSATIATAKREG